MKEHRLFQIFLAAGLACGLMLSPLHAATVGHGARLLDETPAPVEEVPLETTEEASIEVVEPSEAPSSEVIIPIEAPEVEESTPEPESTAEPVQQPTTGGIIIAATPAPEVTVVLTDIPVEAIQPTTFETMAISMEGSSPEAEAAPENPTTTWTSGKIFVQYDTHLSLEEITAALIQVGLIVSEPAISSGMLVVDVPSGLEMESAVLAQSANGVQSASPVQMATAMDLIPNDPQYGDQHNLTMIDAAGGWEYTTGSGSVIIAVIDTGVDYTNTDLFGRVVQGFDFVNNDTNAMDDNGHGTHVAGIIAAIGNNSYGIAGLDWSAKIMPIKVLNSSGIGTELTVYYGILYAVDHGAQIINLSLGMDSNSALVASAVEYAYQHGVTVVASSGNTNSAVTYPAALPHVIAVGAVDDSENHAVFSNHGAELDVVAPGNSILSTSSTGLTTKTGTSMAAPQVTGLVSLLKSIYPVTPGQAKTAIETSSKDLGTTGWDEFFGNGLIQVQKAIEWLLARLASATPREPEDESIPTIVYPTFTPTLTPTMTPTVMSG